VALKALRESQSKKYGSVHEPIVMPKIIVCSWPYYYMSYFPTN
jgi:hypothetical protein